MTRKAATILFGFLLLAPGSLAQGGDPAGEGNGKDPDGDFELMEFKDAYEGLEYYDPDYQAAHGITPSQPSQELLDKVRGMKERAAVQRDDPEPTDEFLDPGRLSIEGRLSGPREIECRGEALFPDDTILTLRVLRRHRPIGVEEEVVVAGRQFGRSIALAGRLPIDGYVLEVRFLLRDQPPDVHEQLTEQGFPNRVEARTTLGTDDPVEIALAGLSRDRLLFDLVRRVGRLAEQYDAVDQGARSKERFWTAGRFSPPAWSHAIVDLRFELDRIRQAILAEREGWLVLDRSRLFDRLEDALTLLLDATYLSTGEVYELAGAIGADRPEMPEHWTGCDESFPAMTSYGDALTALDEVLAALGVRTFEDLARRHLDLPLLAARRIPELFEAWRVQASKEKDAFDRPTWTGWTRPILLRLEVWGELYLRGVQELIRDAPTYGETIDLGEAIAAGERVFGLLTEYAVASSYEVLTTRGIDPQPLTEGRSTDEIERDVRALLRPLKEARGQ